MAIWKLIPINRNHRDWATSRYGKEVREVIIRAKSEERARRVATMAFCAAVTKQLPGDEVPASPWNQQALVSATEVTDSNYPETGQEEILDPEEARAYNNA
jgi:hypothetical protein